MQVQVERRRFSADEFNRMAEVGLLGNEERVELIDGEILRLCPQNKPHAGVTSVLNNLLVRRFGDTHLVRVQLPLGVSDYSEPEPDFAVVLRADVLAARRHPRTWWWRSLIPPWGLIACARRPSTPRPESASIGS